MKIGVWIFKKFFAGKFDFLSVIWETGCVLVLLFFFFLTKECWFSNNFSGALDFIFHCNQTCCHFYSCPIFLFFLVFLACSSRAASIALKNVNNLSVMNYFVFGYVLSVRVSFKVILLEERSRELFFVGINEGNFFFPAYWWRCFLPKHVRMCPTAYLCWSTGEHNNVL